jgi:hypothetical protein
VDRGAGIRFPYGAARQLAGWAAHRWDDLQEAAGWDRPLEAMSARRAYRWLYARLTAPLDDDTRLEVDALLGDANAEAEMQRRRRDAVLAMGGEFA